MIKEKKGATKPYLFSLFPFSFFLLLMVVSSSIYVLVSFLRV